MRLTGHHTGHERLRVRVGGAVQGVGFRPFIHGLAGRFGLAGFVLNDADGVLAEVEGTEIAVFLSALKTESPPLARVDKIDVMTLPPQGQRGFEIRRSVEGEAGTARTVPDTAPCRLCLNDLFDPASRFYLYPFVTCTHCGPRFTITYRLPYDRANTSMAAFALCTACEADYANPASRRFHAETIACPLCEPRLSHSPEDIATALRAGKIVALKGIGGFHLLCDAANEMAVDTLRQRKNRPSKPFAVMVSNEASAALFGAPSQTERTLLGHAARPIVLVGIRNGLAQSVAPRLNHVGLMLPSTLLHYLLFNSLADQTQRATWPYEPQPNALVATSANVAGEPLITNDSEAVQDLAGIADLIVSNDRPIVARADDSVMAVVDRAAVFIRRSRGFVPEPIDLGQDGPAVIAVGAHLKATLCVTRGREAFVSQHVGDLDTTNTVRFYEETARRLLEALGIEPELVACDLHPDYRSTLFAESLGPPILPVQHHRAHLAAVAAEHHLRGNAVGVALDGHGYGDRGEAWGGELMLREDGAWQRRGHLFPLSFPGGNRAAREPWRMGVAALVALGRGAEAKQLFPDIALAGRLSAVVTGDPRGPVTTSMGRLFDSAAALLGLYAPQSYEGQVAMELEALVRTPRALSDGYLISNNVLDFRPLLSNLLAPGLPRDVGAELFHGTLIAGLAEWIGQFALQTDQTDVVLGGGCLMNRVLAEGLTAALCNRGLIPWLPRAVPANDGGLCLGQAALGRAHLMAANLS